MLNICVKGASGRMGAGIVKEIAADNDVNLSGAVEYAGNENIGKDIGEVIVAGVLGINIVDSLETVIEACDVIIDFTNPESTMETLDIAKKYTKAVVIGTTGLSETEIDKIKQASTEMPCLFAPNMSVGMNFLFKIVGEAAKSLGEDFDIEIVEAHHRFKKDAPSGTALKLAEVIANATGRTIAEDVVNGRSGMVGERTKKEIGMHAVRAGDIVGDHTVIYGTLGERVEITHKAHSRNTFVKGSVRAAKFIVGKENGMYNMLDVLNTLGVGR